MYLHTQPAHGNTPAQIRRRPGLAPLEYAMALPLLLLMFMVILSTGYLGLGRQRAGIDVRAKAWKDREEQRTGKPLFFYPQDNALVVTKDKDVKVVLGHKTLKVHAELAVLGGSWDWRDVDPGKKLMETIGLMIVSQGASLPGDLSYILGKLGDLGSLSGAAGSIINQANDANQQGQQAQQQVQQQLEQQRAQNAKDLAKARQDLKNAQDKQTADQAKVKQLQDELAKLTDPGQRAAKMQEIQQAQQVVAADQREVKRLSDRVRALEQAQQAMN
jgi:hypothetical protein